MLPYFRSASQVFRSLLSPARRRPIRKTQCRVPLGVEQLEDRVLRAILSPYASLVESNPSISVFWRLGESSGTAVVDASGNNHPGAYSNSGVTLGVGGPLAGDPSTAAALNGGDVSATLPQSPSFTVEVWANSATPTWNQSGWIASDRGNNGFVIQPNQGTTGWSGYILPATGGNNTTEIGSYTAASIQGWHDYAITYDATTGLAAMYFDGVQVASNTISVSRSSSASPVYLGEDDPNFPSTSGQFGNGSEADFALYTSALSASVILQHYQAATLWMAQLPDSIPLTDISTPGSYMSASGPSMTNAVLGDGATATTAATSGAAADAASATSLTDQAAAFGQVFPNYANGVAGTADPAAGTAGTADATAGTAYATAGSAYATASTANGLAGTADGTASTADGTASTADAAASTADAAASTMGGTADTTAATDDAAAVTADGAANSADQAEGSAVTAAATANTAAATANTAAGSANTAAGTADTAAGIAETATASANGTAASDAGSSATAYAAAAAAYAAYVSATNAAATTGNNSNNMTTQTTLVGLASTAATGDGAAATADAAAASAYGLAATADAAAGTANTAASSANATAATDDATAATADATAATADATAASDDAAAGIADATAATADAAAGTANATAATEDAAAANADTAATSADTAKTSADSSASTDDAAKVSADAAAASADAAAILSEASGTTTAQNAFQTAANADATADAAGVTAANADAAKIAADAAKSAADAAKTAADTAATNADTAATNADTAKTAADAAKVTADAAAGTADAAKVTADATAATANATAATKDAARATADAAKVAADANAATDDAAAAYADAAAVAAAGTTNAASANAAKATADMAKATANAAAATADATAATDDAAAATADATAATDDAAAAAADAAATTADAAKVSADKAASAADTAATKADAAKTTADAAATNADTAATNADATATNADATAATDDAAATNANTAATNADAAAVAAADTMAAANAEQMAATDDAAAASADAAAAAADAAKLVADAAATTADGAKVSADAAAADADAAAQTADAAVTKPDAAAVTADAAVTTADATAASDDMAAATADMAATTADQAAAAADQAATSADQAATTADEAAITAGAEATIADQAATTANLAFAATKSADDAIVSSVQTQTQSIADQLNAGIRSFDLRGALVNDTININSGQYFTGLTLQNVLDDATAYLQANPTETIVISLTSNEAPPVGSSNSFSTDLNTLLQATDSAVTGTHTYDDFIYSSADSTVTPTLSQVRGKIVIIPSGWVPAADPATGLQIGWQPTEVVQDSHTDSDPAVRWNHAELGTTGTQANPNAGLIATDLGNPDTLYQTNLSQDGSGTNSALSLAATVNSIAELYFASFHVNRTTGIVGMNNPGATLIAEIIDENNLPIMVTSDSDTAGATGTLRAAINTANSQPGVNTIELANNLAGTTGQAINLQADLPVITSDVDIAGTVFIVANGHLAFQNAPSVTEIESDFVATTGAPPPIAPMSVTYDNVPVFVNTSAQVFANQTPITVAPTVRTPITSVAATSAWMAQLPDSIPLTDISLPGTYMSASGPSVANALSGNEALATTAAALEDASYAADALSLTATLASLLANYVANTRNAAAVAAANKVTTFKATPEQLAEIDNLLAGAADATAGGADTAAGGADATAGAADVTAGAADVTATVEAGVDPVADGAAGVADGAAAGADGAADTANVAADGANGTADTENGLADGANSAAIPVETAAAGAALAAAPLNAAAAPANTAAAIVNYIASARYGTSSVSDTLTAAADSAYAAEALTNTGGNPSNAALQQALGVLALNAAARNTAAIIPNANASAAYFSAATANTTAATADTAAATADTTAAASDAVAETDDAAATVADSAATAADSAATAADSAATAADSAAATADAAAATVDGLEVADTTTAIAADAAAAAADATAIALDATALATVEVPFVDIGTAAAAAAADGVAVGLDAAAATADALEVAADAGAATADGLATGLDATAVTADAAAVTADAAATSADETAAAADETAAAATNTAALDNQAEEAADATAAADNTAAISLDAAAAAAADAATPYNVSKDLASVEFLAAKLALDNTISSATTQTNPVYSTDNSPNQLNAGIRSLDIRGALVNDTINVNSGQYFTGITLQDVLNDSTAFLQANPTETIVITLSSNEAAPVGSSNTFSTDFNTLLSKTDTAVTGTHTYDDFIYSSASSTTTPDLGQVRGKIVIVPSGWTPAADPATGLQVGWQPNQVVQDSPTVSDPATLWNDAETGAPGNPNAGLIATDIGNPNTLYRTNLSQDSSGTSSPLDLAASVNSFATQYFASVNVNRTTGIVGMNNPGATLIDEIINENNMPIMVTSDSDAAGATGTLRAAINAANALPGVDTIEIANNLTGTSGQTILLQADLPVITSDLDIVGPVYIDAHGHKVFQSPPRNVTEADIVAFDSAPLEEFTNTQSVPVYMNTSGLTVFDHLGFGTAPQMITAGVNSMIMTLQLQDAMNNAVTVAGGAPPLAVSLTTNSASANAEFLAIDGITKITWVSFTAGNNGTSFLYYDEKRATPTLTATLVSAPVTQATQIETVNANAPVNIVYTSQFGAASFNPSLSSIVNKQIYYATVIQVSGYLTVTSNGPTLALTGGDGESALFGSSPTTSGSSISGSKAAVLTIGSTNDTLKFTWNGVALRVTLTHKTYAAATLAAALQGAINGAILTHYGLTTGTQVVYNNGGGTSIGMLSEGASYYVIRTATNGVELAKTFANATAKTPVPIALGPSLGAGIGHTLTPIVSVPSVLANVSLQPTLQLMDAFDNLVPNWLVTLTLNPVSVPGMATGKIPNLYGPTTNLTDTNGLTSFPTSTSAVQPTSVNLPGTYTLTASITVKGKVLKVTSNRFTISANPATVTNRVR